MNIDLLIHFPSESVSIFPSLIIKCLHVPLSQLSIRAMQGGAAENELRNGSAIPDELVVNIIVEAIR